MRRVIAVGLSLFSLACGSESEPASEPTVATLPAVPVRPPLPIVASHRVSSRAAFDLVSLSDGAALVWGAQPTDGGGVRGRLLSRTGAPRGHEVVVASDGDAEDVPGVVEELVASTVDDRVAVAWITRRGGGVRSFATIATAAVEGFAPATELGPTTTGERGTRGRLAAWGSPELGAVVAHRVLDGRCVANPGECARFTLRGLGSAAARGPSTSEIVDACDPLLVGALARRNTIFYGTCHRGPAGPTTTLFAIDPGSGSEGALASAPEVLTGCIPRGIAPSERGALAVGECPEGLRVQAIDARGEQVAAVHGAEVAIRCDQGRPSLVIDGAGGPYTEALTTARARLESVLPARIAPPGARAVWTAEALLVAVPSGPDVALHRYACEDGEFLRTDLH